MPVMISFRKELTKMLKFIILLLALFFGIVFALDLKIKDKKKKEKKSFRWPRIERLEKFQNKISYMLMISNSRISVRSYFEFMVLLFFLGLAVGVFYNNIFASIILSLGLPFFQYQVLLKKKQDMTRNHNEKLEMYMGMVTNAYMQSGDIETAITESYGRMDIKEAASKPFGAFIGQAAGNANISQCIIDMKKDIDNVYFHQWCDKLLLCRENSSLKQVLPYVVNRMRRKRTLDNETVSSVQTNYKDFRRVVGLALIGTFLFPLSQPAWRFIVTDTLLGKIAITMVAIVILISSAYVVKVNSPSKN